MRQRLQESVGSEDRLSAEQVRAIVDRLSERKAQQIGRSARSIDEVATLLGTTPEDICRIASEAPVRRRQRPRLLRSPWPQLTIAAIGVVMWGFTLIRSEALASAARISGFQGGPLNGSMEPILNYDPYARAYTRDQSQLFFHPPQDELLVDRSIKPPPQGFRITLITPQSRKIIAGPPGKAKDEVAARAQLRASLRSLVEYEERLATVSGDLPVVDYVTAPWEPNQANYQGQPMFPGWHDVEISTGAESFTGLLPDSRYAKDTRAFVASFEERLNWLSDKKFFSTAEPANLKPGAVKIPPEIPPPPGYSILMWDDKKTVWADGGPARGSLVMSADGAKKRVREALQSFTDYIDLHPVFSTHPALLNGKYDNALRFMVEYPGGERLGSWNLDTDPDMYPRGMPQGKESMLDTTLEDSRQRSLDYLAEGAAAGLEARSKPIQRITYRKAPSKLGAH